MRCSRHYRVSIVPKVPHSILPTHQVLGTIPVWGTTRKKAIRGAARQEPRMKHNATSSDMCAHLATLSRLTDLPDLVSRQVYNDIRSPAVAYLLKRVAIALNIARNNCLERSPLSRTPHSRGEFVEKRYAAWLSQKQAHVFCEF